MMDYFSVIYLNSNQTCSAAVITPCKPNLSEQEKKMQQSYNQETILFSSQHQNTSKSEIPSNCST